MNRIKLNYFDKMAIKQANGFIPKYFIKTNLNNKQEQNIKFEIEKIKNDIKKLHTEEEFLDYMSNLMKYK